MEEGGFWKEIGVIVYFIWFILAGIQDFVLMVRQIFLKELFYLLLFKRFLNYKFLKISIEVGNG